MPLTYTIAPTVRVGDPVSAADMAGIADATNTRVLGGAGDPHWRIPYYFFTLFRQLRNPDELGNFPAEAEYFHLYQHLDPRDADWPLTGAGDPEGANVANPLMAYIAGSEALDLASERARLAAVPTDLEGRDVNVPLSPWQLHQLGKAQRGAVDPRTGLLASPLFDLAQAPMGIRVSSYSQYLNDFGGYLPGPARITPGCAAIGDLIPPNRQVFFTSLLDPTVVKTYAGTCPEQGTHIAHVAYQPLAYVVYLNNGRVDYLPKNRWIEGPYTADAQLRKNDGGLLSRIQTAFAAEFRGSAEERATKDGGESTGFQLQDFLTRQYPLAPQLGREVGGGGVEALYPEFRVTGSAGTVLPMGTRLRDRRFGPHFPVPAGFVTTHVFILVAGVKQSFRLGVYAGEELVETIPVTVAGYGADQVHALETPRRIAPLRFALLDSVEMTGTSASIEVTATVLLEYKPSKEDWFAVVRVGSWTASFENVDGQGIDEPNARQLSAALSSYGCLLRTNQASDTAPVGAEPPVNKNAVFEAARQLSKCVRIVRRQQVVRYAVVGGKSILWVRRFAYGLHADTPADIMEGIAPSRTEVAAADLTLGQSYTVTSGTVKHGGRSYMAGQTFTPTRACTGDGICVEAEGIRARALRRGYSNRWCLSLTFDPYHPSLSSLWKPDGFADQKNPFGNRCLFDDPDAASDGDVLRHGAFGVKPFYKGEMPSGYRYVPTPLSTWGRDNANQGASEAFFRSCRVYEPPVEIESATLEGTGADTLVKLTLTGRLQSHHDPALCPASISEDITAWNRTLLQTESEDYATDENRLRQYLVHQYYGTNCDRVGPGNYSHNSNIRTDPDNPYGSCYPNVLLVKLIPEPYLDGNTVGQPTDSEPLSEHLRLVELYLRAMCSGFVDGRTTGVNACASSTTTVYDYTWGNLWFDAIGNRYLPLLPETVRPDNPEGHGPSPLTLKYADLFNGLAAAVNRLDKVRVMLPMTLEQRTITRTYDLDVTNQVRIASGGLASVEGRNSDSGADYAVWLNTGPREGSLTTTDSGWIPGTTGGVSTSVNLFVDSGSVFLRTQRQEIDWRWAPDAGSEYALPPTIASLVSTHAAVVLRTQTITSYERFNLVAGSTSGTQCSPSGSADDWQTGTGDSVLFAGTTVTEDPRCVSFSSVISGGEAKTADVWYLDPVAGDGFPPCVGSSTRTVNIEAINTDTPVVRIPTAAYGRGS